MPDPSPDSPPRRRAPKQPAAKHTQSTTPASASPESLAFPRDRISKLRSATLAWYDTHGRSLPWRQQQDPYRIWLSEIMLQQTTVAAVIPYFQRFTNRFPDVQTLAAASVDDVLRLWEGLGYYSRARNLHQAAIMVVQNFGGQFPADVKLLQSLPGIGRYTAGAIASFAFDLPAPIVEANTERLYARLLALQDDVRSSSAQKQLWQFAESIVPARRAADFNQAVMDLGAQICRPEDPNCPQCPLLKCCRAFQSSLQHVLPRRQPRTPITLVSELAVVPFQNQRFLLRRRAAHERWAGMWDATRLEISDELRQQVPCPPSHKRSTKPRERSLFPQTAALLDPTLQQQIADQCGAVPGILLDSMELTYSVTRYRVQLLTVLCEVSGTTTMLPDTEWFTAEDLASLPLSRTGRQIADWLQSFSERGGSQ
ncbi:MAG: A/G-specific adenine glycosylase [Planctomycetota bacterium]